MTARFRHWLVALLAVVTVDIVIHLRLVWLTAAVTFPFAAAYVVGQFAGCRTRFEQAGRHQVDELARARARRDRIDHTQ